MSGVGRPKSERRSVEEGDAGAAMERVLARATGTSSAEYAQETKAPAAAMIPRATNNPHRGNTDGPRVGLRRKTK
jgi:hypothetical protein